MKNKRLIAIVLAVGLLFCFAIPVMALRGDDGSYKDADQNHFETVAPASPSDAWQDTSPEAKPAAPGLHKVANALPPQPTTFREPSFSAMLIFDEDGYGVQVTVDSLPAEIKDILPMVSVDQIDYEEPEDFSWTVEGTASQIYLREGDSFERYLCGLEEELWIKLQVTLMGGTRYETASVQVVRENVLPPDEPPAFETEIIVATGQGSLLFGKFTAFTPAIKTLQPVYSLDGEEYHPVLEQDGSALFWDLTLPIQSQGINSLTHQPCAMSHMEPFDRYLEGGLDEFFVKLRITDWSENSYDTQPCLVQRQNGAGNQAFTATAGWPAMMRGRDSVRPPTPYYGKVFVTAQEGMTAEELETLLPAALPIEIQLMKPDQYGVPVFYDSGLLSYPVEWTLPPELTLIPGETVVFPNAIVAPVIPAGQEVAMSQGVYTLAEGAPFDTRYMSTELRLFVTVLPESAGPDLRLSDQLEVGDGPLALWLAFAKKPSGATAIHYFYYMEDMEDWVEVGELLSQVPVDEKPGNSASEYYTLFTPEQSPYQEFLAGEHQGFLVGIEMEGGVFDGMLSTARWPKEYELPVRIPNFNGSGGNENNVGGGNTNSGDSSGDGGQRPGLPGEKEPPTLPPTGGGNPESKSDLESMPAKQPPLLTWTDQPVMPAVAATRESSTPSVPQSPPQATAPSTFPDPSTVPETLPQSTEEIVRTPGESKKFPPIAAASVVVVCVAATAAIGTAAGAGGAASKGTTGRMLYILKRFFLRK